MEIDRAIEILNPEHREHYDSIETVNEACRMGMAALEAMKSPLHEFIKREVPFRLLDIMGVSEEAMEDIPVDEIVEKLYEYNDVMFDYDAIDEFLRNELHERGLDYVLEEEDDFGEE